MVAVGMTCRSLFAFGRPLLRPDHFWALSSFSTDSHKYLCSCLSVIRLGLDGVSEDMALVAAIPRHPSSPRLTALWEYSQSCLASASGRAYRLSANPSLLCVHVDKHVSMQQRGGHRGTRKALTPLGVEFMSITSPCHDALHRNQVETCLRRLQRYFGS